MATYLFTWNPKRWIWDDLPEFVEEVNEFGSSIRRWSCGNTKKIRPGDRAFLIRLGIEPRGIMGSGEIINRPYAASHWDRQKAEAGETAFYVDIEFDALLHPDSEPIFPRSTLANPSFQDMHWDAQSSGTTIPEQVAVALEQQWNRFLDQAPELPNTVAEPTKHYEGMLREVKLTRYERDPEARRICLEHYGPRCTVCGFDFEETFGEVGKGFMHVHHLTPLSERGKEHEVDPIRDLRPVCPNCHGIIHRRKPPYAMEEMQEMRKSR